MLVKPGTQEMITDNPDIHKVVVFPQRDKNASLFQHITIIYQILKELRQQRFDLAINTTEGDRGIIISYLARAGKRLGYLRKKDKFWRKAMLTDHLFWRDIDHHTVLQNLELVSNLITIDCPISVKLFYKADIQLKIKKLLTKNGWESSQPIIHIHPVSRRFFKCWQDDKMASTIDFIQSKLNAVAVLTCSPDKKEINKLDGIIKQCKTTPINLGGQLTLKELAALSDLSRLFFGVDSAPMHMAAALDTPVIAVFGPSKVKLWGPWPNGRTTLETPYQRSGIQRAGLHTVLQQNWKCVPCSKAGCDSSNISECLVDLPEQWVHEQLQKKWESLIT